MNVLVTGGNGQLGNSLRIAAAEMAGAPGVQGSPAAQRPRTEDNPAFNFLFSDVNEASEESVAMLRKLGGEGVDTSTTRLDITDLEAIRALVREHHIDAIVNCAAFTNVDAAESQPELAELLNAKAPENLAVAMRESGGLLVHVSTDYVFGAEPYNTPCREDQQGTPTGVYGLTKLHGEQAVRRVGCRHVIIRTAWLYSEFGKNFVRTMLHLTATRPQLKVVFDQVGTPTYAGDLASAILTILKAAASPAGGPELFFVQSLEKPIPAPTSTTPAHAADAAGSTILSEIPDQIGDDRISGIYHFSNEGVCSWYDFAKAIAEMADQVGHDAGFTPGSGTSVTPGSNYVMPGSDRTFHSACAIQPCHSDEFPSPVRRPAYSVLDKTRIKATFGLSIPYWTDSLRRCLASLV